MVHDILRQSGKALNQTRWAIELIRSSFAKKKRRCHSGQCMSPETYKVFRIEKKLRKAHLELVAMSRMDSKRLFYERRAGSAAMLKLQNVPAHVPGGVK
jgi:hypothetical protein